VADGEVFPEPLLIFGTYTIDLAEPFVTLVAYTTVNIGGPSPLSPPYR